jgi:hypothetical protein
MLQYESVRAKIEFKAVAAVSGLPYVLMLWLFSLLVANWASIYYAAKADDLRGIGNAFDKIRPYFFGANLVASVLFISLFTSLALSDDADQRKSLTLTGTVIYAIIVLVLSVAYACYGYGLMVQLSKDFKSSSAERLCKVGVIFCICFAGEAGIWLLSGMASEVFFANFELVNSIFFTLDLIALICILIVTRKTLVQGVKNKAAKTMKTPFGLFKSKPRPMMSMKAVANKKGKSVGAGRRTDRASTTGGSATIATNDDSKKGGKLKAAAKSGLMAAGAVATKRSKPRRVHAAKKFGAAPPADWLAPSEAPKNLDPDHPSNAAVPFEKRVMLAATSDEEYLFKSAPVSGDDDAGGSDIDFLNRHSTFSAQGDVLLDIDSISREITPRSTSRKSPSKRVMAAAAATAAAAEAGAEVEVEANLVQSIEVGIESAHLTSFRVATEVHAFNSHIFTNPSLQHWMVAIDGDGSARAAAALGIRMGDSDAPDGSSDVNLDELAAVLFSDSETPAAESAAAVRSDVTLTGFGVVGDDYFGGDGGLSGSGDSSGGSVSSSVDDDSVGDLFATWSNPFSESSDTLSVSTSDSALDVGDSEGTSGGKVDWMANIRDALADFDLSLSSSSSGSLGNMSDLFSFASDDSSSTQ